MTMNVTLAEVLAALGSMALGLYFTWGWFA